MPITEQDLETATELLRAEFKSKLDAVFQELSVRITEAHNGVAETTAADMARKFEAARAAENAFREGMENQLEEFREGAVASVVVPVVDETLVLRVERQHAFLDDLADRLGVSRMGAI